MKDPDCEIDGADGAYGAYGALASHTRFLLMKRIFFVSTTGISRRSFQ